MAVPQFHGGVDGGSIGHTLFQLADVLVPEQYTPPARG
jgi:hypothetical protein